MKITTSLTSTANSLTTIVSSDGLEKVLALPVKADGYGAEINGGELLLTALAVCYCNDIYREAKKRKINITSLEITCSGTFPVGKPAERLRYNVLIEADARAEEIGDLILRTDEIAEVNLTLRRPNSIEFEDFVHDHDHD